MAARSLTYPHEKFMVAVQAMATIDQPLRKRINSAWMSFHPLRPEDFDEFPDIREKYVELMDRLTRHGADAGDEGTIPKTIRLSSDEEIGEIADLIFHIYHSIYYSYFEGR